MIPSRARGLFTGTRAIIRFRHERDALVANIQRYLVILRQPPVGNDLVEVTLAIHSLKNQADKLKWASETVAIDARDMKYVSSKGVRYFSRTVPALCDELGHDTRKMAKTLMDHIDKPVVNTEHHISLDLEHALANLGFA